MICGTSQQRLIGPYQSREGDLFGCEVADAALVAATLNANEGLRWDFWTSDLGSTAMGGGMDGRPGSLEALRRSSGSRTATLPLRLLPEATSNGDYLLITSVPQLWRMNELRARLASSCTPICAVLHAALATDAIPFYLSLMLSAEPGDVLVATSEAGRVALEAILEGCAEKIAAATGTLPIVRPEIAQIPLGVDIPNVCALDGRAARTLLQIPHQNFVILYLGRLSEEYKADLDPLLQAVSELSRRRSNVTLILAGQQQKKSSAALGRRIGLLGLTRRTVILENFPDFLKSPIYAACDVFVSPVDSIQETFGLSVLEAMAHGKPVVASDWSGYRDLVLNGETGFLLKTRWSRQAAEEASRMSSLGTIHGVAHYLAQRTIIDAGELTARLEELANDSTLARRMGDSGRRRVIERFAWPVAAQRFLALWKSQIEQVKGRPQSYRPALSLDRVFGHYASDETSPDDILVRMEHAIDAEELPDHWGFSNDSEYESICDILDRCARRPVRIGDLHSEGVSDKCITWVIKKGLCRFISRADADRL